MVIKKYLCAAPRPESWDDHVEAVLKNIGGGSKDAKATLLKQMIESCKAMHPLNKSGPGRKSNAEHAVNFYEYVLERLTADDDEEEEEEEEMDETGDAQDTTQAEEEGSDDMSSMNTQEFNESHNEECEVCDETGELLMCSTCNLVFHLDCVRPVMTELPEDKNWRCAYCVLSTEPKNTKPRKQAAAAVRLMARIRNQKERQGKEKKKEKAEKKDQESVKEETTTKKQRSAFKSVPEKMLGVEVEKEKSPASQKESADPAEFATPLKDNTSKVEKETGDDEDDKEDTGRSSRRSRKQPTLYDPQSGPARMWQSDELQDWKFRHMDASKSDEEGDNNDSATDDDDDGTKKKPDKAEKGTEEKAATGRRDRGDSIWCGFCNDDPNIPICCFCACRVCFGKQNQTKLLLCDRCDDEYHTFCLDPPLRSVPSTKKWFCPSCSASQEKTTRKATSRIGTRGASKTPTRGANKTRTPSPTRASSRKAASTESRPSGRPRGRPKKSPATASGGKSRKRDRSATSTSPTRKRGRAGKSKSPSSNGRDSVALKSNTKKAAQGKETAAVLPGNVPAAVSSIETSKVIADTPRVQAPISIAVDASSFSASAMANDQQTPASEAGSSQSVKTSRSGRQVKRSSFHDEIDQSEQHLRNLRYTPESQRKMGDSSRLPEQITEFCATESVDSKPTAEPTKAPSPPASVLDLPPPQVPVPASVNVAMPTLAAAAAAPKVEAEVAITVTSSTERATAAVPVVKQAPPPPVTAETNVTLKLPPTMEAPIPVSVIAPAAASLPVKVPSVAVAADSSKDTKMPRRKPGARECMQISRRFGVREIPPKYMEVLLDYCKRGKVEHLIRMRERLDDHSRYLEAQLAGLEALVKEKGESDVVVPAVPVSAERKLDGTSDGHGDYH
jgi:hypothetical protein